MMKENVGFEPTRRFPDLTVFKTVPFSQTWVILHKYLRPKWTLLDSNQRPDGYEPSALTNWAKGPISMSQSRRGESNPRPPGYEPDALASWATPRNITLSVIIGTTGFEPATPWSQTRCSTKLSYVPNMLTSNNKQTNVCNAPRRIRTFNLLIRSQTLYPVAL